jgi:hypothetical protein
LASPRSPPLSASDVRASWSAILASWGASPRGHGRISEPGRTTSWGLKSTLGYAAPAPNESERSRFYLKDLDRSSFRNCDVAILLLRLVRGHSPHPFGSEPLQQFRPLPEHRRVTDTPMPKPELPMGNFSVLAATG